MVPKKEVDLIFDLDSESYQQLFDFSKAISKAIQKAISCERVTLHVIGLEVPHAHIHLIPINSMNDCNFANQKLQLAKEEFEEIAKRISDSLSIS